MTGKQEAMRRPLSRVEPYDRFLHAEDGAVEVSLGEEAMFSRPVSSGWKPVPTSSREATLPQRDTEPQEGAVMRERILRRVDLPAPLRPMSWNAARSEGLRRG